MTILLVLLLVSLQTSLVQLQEPPSCNQRIEKHLTDLSKIGKFFDSLRREESDGDLCNIGENGIGPYQISEQYYKQAVGYNRQLRNGGTYLVSRGQTAFFRFICGSATTNKMEKSGLATRD